MAIWTEIDDSILVQGIKDLTIGEKMELEETFKEVQSKLSNRTVAAIRARWHVIKEDYPEVVGKITTAQKPYTDNEDFKIVQVIFENMEKGLTIGTSFNQLAEELGRSASGVAFRWNAVIKKNFKSEYEEAKRKASKKVSKPKGNKKNKRLGKPRGTYNTKKKKAILEEQQISETFESDTPQSTIVSPSKTEVIDKPAVTTEEFKQATDFVTQVTELIEKNKALQLENESFKALNMIDKKSYDELKEENERLKLKIQKIESEAEAAKEDYKVVLGLMDKARKLMLDEEEEKMKESKPKFKMDRNGNLERIE